MEQLRQPAVYSAVILGAGMAGLSAAQRFLLHPDGLKDVVVVEARDRVGGRVRIELHDGVKMHMGAQWIHHYTADNTLIKLAEKYGLISEAPPMTAGDMNPDTFSDTKNVFTSSGQRVPERLAKQAAHIYQMICQFISKSSEDKALAEDSSITTVDDLFERFAQRELSSLSNKGMPDQQLSLVAKALYGFKNELAHYVCGDLRQCGLKTYMSCDIVEGDDVDLPLELIDQMLQELPADSILLQHEVIRIDWSRDHQVHITCVVGPDRQVKTLVCERVICSLPIGVLQRHHATLFEPQLPHHKIQAIFSICPGMTSKYMVAWDKAWNDRMDYPVVLAWSKQELDSIHYPDEWYKGIRQFSALFPEKNMMIVWIASKSSKVADSLPDWKIKKGIGFVLRAFTGNPNIPDPDHLYRVCWTTDPFTLGAYSFPRTCAPLDAFKQMSSPIPSEDNPRILFCGEATHDQLWSFLHGARLTGIAAAERVIACIRH